MKRTPILFPLFFLLCAFTSYLPSATADDDHVYDTDGDKLQYGVNYFVLPVIRGNGGGIQVAKAGNETCPLTVVQSGNELSEGLPIKIASRSAGVAFITQGQLFKSIQFGVFPSTLRPGCPPSPIPSKWDPPSEWTIVAGLPERGLAVKLVGYQNRVSGWFSIVKVADDASSSSVGYKLVFCRWPEEEVAIHLCKNVGIHTDGKGIRRLVLSANTPLVVQFQKFRSALALNKHVLSASV
ncbi:hypothetical protein AAZX31_08G332300 [Glycine max]